MTGTRDVQQRMWPGPKKDPIALPAAIAQRRLIRDSYLEEVMQPVDDRPGQPGSFSRHALLNYNAVTSRYEYASLDTRASQLMVEQTLPIAFGVSPTELKLQGGSFLAPRVGKRQERSIQVPAHDRRNQGQPTDRSSVSYAAVGAAKDRVSSVRVCIYQETIG
jgi:hypothetical protein